MSSSHKSRTLQEALKILLGGKMPFLKYTQKEQV